MTRPVASRYATRVASRRLEKLLRTKAITAVDVFGELVASPAIQILASKYAEEARDYGLLIDAGVDYAIAKLSAQAIANAYIDRLRAISMEVQRRADRIVLSGVSRVFSGGASAVAAARASAVALGQAVTAGQMAVGSLTSAAMSAKLGADPIPPDPSITMRNGVDKVTEYERPFRLAQKAFEEQGSSLAEAEQQAVKRARSLAAVDLQMAKIRQSQIVMTENGVLFYRRVPTSPDPCELCLITSSNVYATNELMPIHTHCACNVEPIDIEKIDGPPTAKNVQYQLDSVAKLPTADGDQKKLIGGLLEEDAPVEAFRNLIAVREHGEVGPWLTWRHQDSSSLDVPGSASRPGSTVGAVVVSGSVTRATSVGLEGSRIPTFNDPYAGVDDVGLPWRGLPVAKPTNRGEFDDLTDFLWEANFFDEVKGPMRDAIRDVQRNGYKGLRAEAAKVLPGEAATTKGFHDKWFNSFVPFGMIRAAKGDVKFWNNLSEEGKSVVRLAGKEIAARAINGKPFKTKIWRGMALKKTDFDDLAVGDELSLPASSFVDKQRPALEAFALDGNFWVSRDRVNGVPVLVEVLPGSKGAKINYTFANEPNEIVSFGRFEIVEIKQDTYINGGVRVPYTKIVVRHKSLTESRMVEFTGSQQAVAAAPRPETSSGTDEYTIVKKPVRGEVPPPEDSLDWTKVHPGEIADYGGNAVRTGVQLEARYPKIDVDVTSDIDNGVFLDTARQLDSLLQRYPQARLRQLTTEEMSANSSRYAEADVWQEGLPLDRDFTAIEIRLNGSRYRTPGELEAKYGRDIEAGWHPPKGESSAAEAIITHEFAHVLDAAGSYRASRDAADLLRRLFITENPQWETRFMGRATAYIEWLRGSLTGYSFTRSSVINPTEALANAFVHVELSPSTASSAERALHKLLVDSSTMPINQNLTGPAWRLAGMKPDATPAAVSRKLEKERNGANLSDQQRRENQRTTQGRSARSVRKVGKGSRAGRKRDDVKQRAAAELARKQIEAKRLMREARGRSGYAKPKGEEKYGSVTSRIKEGKSIEPVFYVKRDGTLRMSEQTIEMTVRGKKVEEKVFMPVIDQKATWDSISDETLAANWRAAIDAAESWAVEAGMLWYDDLRDLCVNLAAAYGDSFKRRYDIELTPEVVAGIISSYSTNNGWSGNLVGAVKFLSDTFDKGLGEKGGGKIGFYKSGSIDPRAMHFQNAKWGVKPMIQYLQKGGTVVEYFANNKDAPKPYNFVMSILGDRDAATVDRWVARIMLHTNDYWLADKLWASSSKSEGRYGFDRMKRIIQKVAEEDGGMAAYMAQAIPWVHVNGPRGAVAELEVAALFDAATSVKPNKAVEALLLDEARSRGWVDENNRAINRNPAA